MSYVPGKVMSINLGTGLLLQLGWLRFANETSLTEEVQRACADFIKSEVLDRSAAHKRDLARLHADNQAALDAYMAGRPVPPRKAWPIAVPRNKWDQPAVCSIPIDDLVMLDQLAQVRGVKAVDLIREACARRTKHEIDDNREEFDQRYATAQVRASALIQRLVNER